MAYHRFNIHLSKPVMHLRLTICLLLCYGCLHAQTAHAYDVVIDEIMADPSPAVGLPGVEFVELKNTSKQSLALNGWHFGDESSLTSINTNFVLQPDSFVILCSNSSLAAMSAFGAAVGISSFPSLNNDGDVLYLQSKEGRTIHTVSYTLDWYRNPVKRLGGWTLEMIDPGNPCSGPGNWMASLHPAGGTPGKKNSVDAPNRDDDPPSLMRAFATDANHILLEFNEGLDSTLAAVGGHYTISDIGSATKALVVAPAFNRVLLTLAMPLLQKKIYEITVSLVTDCAGNPVGLHHFARVGLPLAIQQHDIVINELLFNPAPDGVDYIELYNRSDHIINLHDVYLTNRGTSVLGTPRLISENNRLLFPGEYLLLSEDALAVQRQYLAKDVDVFINMNPMPSMPDDKGDIALLNAQGLLIDEVAYDEHWQFALLDNREGVALERIDYNKASQDASNWHSAATSAGYGTPGYQNSQWMGVQQLTGKIGIAPAIFSPDNDGHDDFLTVSYQFTEPGYVCNIIVYDAAGRSVRYIARNALCGLQGYYRWDGLDERSAKLPVGTYIIFTEVFNTSGKKASYKNAVTLARQLN